MERTEQQLSIINDAISQIENGMYTCSRTEYVSYKIPPEEAQQFFLSNRCHVCALGSLLVSRIRLYNEVGTDNIGLQNDECRSNVFKALPFSAKELCQTEALFMNDATFLLGGSINELNHISAAEGVKKFYGYNIYVNRRDCAIAALKCLRDGVFTIERFTHHYEACGED